MPTLGPAASPRAVLPTSGAGREQIREALSRARAKDYDWRAGRILCGVVYHHSDEVEAVSREAYGAFYAENAMSRTAFPSVARMEAEVIEYCLSLLGAPADAAGAFTSGGTESIFLAVKTARDYARARRRSGDRLNIAIPNSAHPAFDKAAAMLDLEVRRVPVGADFRVSTRALLSATDSSTAMIVGSAPCYPLGVFDPIGELSEQALSIDAWLHVDACVGGLLAPFFRLNGEAVPEFDFALPGVRSISADLHKYGYCTKGASVLLLRHSRYEEYLWFRSAGAWQSGSYSTRTLSGSRAAGAVAAAWAVMNYLGQEGYRDGARRVARLRAEIERIVSALPGIGIAAPSDLCIVLLVSRSDEVDIFAVGDRLLEHGWYLGRVFEPRALHLMINPVHERAIEDFARDLAEVVDQVKREHVRGRLRTDLYTG